MSAFDPKPTSARLLTDAETIAPAVNAGEPARKYRRDGSALCYRYWRNSSGRCRLPRYLTGPACRIGRLGWPAHSTERLGRSSHGLAYQRLMLDRAHPQLLLAIDDGACFEQNRRHVGVSKHDQLVVAIDSRYCVDQQPLATAHVPFRVVGRVMQPALQQLTAKQPGEQQTAGTVAAVL